jgi:hypothetical protein
MQHLLGDRTDASGRKLEKVASQNGGQTRAEVEYEPAILKPRSKCI